MQESVMVRADSVDCLLHLHYQGFFSRPSDKEVVYGTTLLYNLSLGCGGYKTIRK